MAEPDVSGKPLFPGQRAYMEGYPLSGSEALLYMGGRPVRPAPRPRRSPLATARAVRPSPVPAATRVDPLEVQEVSDSPKRPAKRPEVGRRHCRSVTKVGGPCDKLDGRRPWLGAQRLRTI